MTQLALGLEVGPGDATRAPLGVRHSDPTTSLDAAVRNLPRRGVQQAAVLEVARRLGRFTDADLIRELPGMVAGSVIKRRGELVRAGWLVDTGVRREVEGRRVWATARVVCDETFAARARDVETGGRL